jgi:hypothetical protein
MLAFSPKIFASHNMSELGQPAKVLQAVNGSFDENAR